jgi:hypothetical protein
MWHANGMTGEERLGAGGEVEALRPPARSPLFAGASSRHHLPKVERPASLFLPGRFAEPVLAPDAVADSIPEVKNAGGSRTCLNGVTAGFWVFVSGGGGYSVPTMAEPEPSRSELRSRVEQARAQSQTLQELIAELAEAITWVELDVARVHEAIAEQGGSLAARAREHARRAREFAAREHAEAVRWRRVGRAEDR